MNRKLFVLSLTAICLSLTSLDAQDLNPDQGNFVEQIERLSSQAGGLQNLIKQMNEDRRKPIDEAPVKGGRVNGFILDSEGNPIKFRDVKACERDIVGRAVMEWYASDDGFFDMLQVRDTNNKISFEAEGYETQTLPFDRGTYQIRLKKAACTLKPGDVITGRVLLGNWTNAGGISVDEIDADGKVVAGTKTVNGEFKLTIVKPGNTLRVSMDGYNTFSTPIEISNYNLGLEKIK